MLLAVKMNVAEVANDEMLDTTESKATIIDIIEIDLFVLVNDENVLLLLAVETIILETVLNAGPDELD